MKKRIISLLLCAVLISGMLPVQALAAEPVRMYELQDDPFITGEYPLTDWMSYMPDSVYLSELNIPGTHDSGTKYLLEDVSDYLGSCQDMQIDEQLQHGIRVFDIRLDCAFTDVALYWMSFKTYSIDYTDLSLEHGPTYCTKGGLFSSKLYFQDVIRWCDSFLAGHPGETVILKVTDECAATGDTGVLLVQDALRKYASHPSSDRVIAVRSSDQMKVHTLGDVRGRIILLTDYEEKTFTKYEDHSSVQADEKREWLWKCLEGSTRMQRFSSSDDGFSPVYRKDEMENEEGREGEPDVKLVFTSSNALFKGSPEIIARSTWKGLYIDGYPYPVVPWLENYFARDAVKGIRYGWILMDYPTDELIRSIIATNIYEVDQAASMTVNVDWGEANSACWGDEISVYRRSFSHEREPVPEGEYSIVDVTRILAGGSGRSRLTQCIITGLSLTDEEGDDWEYTVELNGTAAGHTVTTQKTAESEKGVGPYLSYRHITQNVKVVYDEYGAVNAALADAESGQYLGSVPFIWKDETVTVKDMSPEGYQKVIAYDQFIDPEEYLIRSVKLNGADYRNNACVLTEDLDQGAENEMIFYVSRMFKVDTKYCVADFDRAPGGQKITVQLLKDHIPDGQLFCDWVILKGEFDLYETYRADDDASGELLCEVTFTMPYEDVKIKAGMYDIGDPIPHSIKVTGGSADRESAVEGTVIKLDATEIFGFVRWEAVSGDVEFADETDPETTFEMPYENVVIRAVNLELNNVRVEYGAAFVKINGDPYFCDRAPEGMYIDKLIANAPDMYILNKYGDPVSLSDFGVKKPLGKYFDQWICVPYSADEIFGDKYSVDTYFTMPDKDISITARFVDSPDELLRRLHVLNGTAEAVDKTDLYGGKLPGSDVIEYLVSLDREVILTAGTVEGQLFDHWEIVSGKLKLSDVKSPVIRFTMPNSDVEIHAVFKEIHTVTVKDGTADPLKAVEGTKITLSPDAAPAGKGFFGWEVFSGDVKISNLKDPGAYFIMPDEDVKIKAVFRDEHTVTVHDGTADPDAAIEGTDVTITADKAPEGMEFDRWEIISGDIALGSKYDSQTAFFMPDGAVEVKALYKDIEEPSDTYSIMVIGGTSGVSEAKEGETVALKADSTPAGQVFEKWEGVPYEIDIADISAESTTFTMPGHDVVLHAEFVDAEKFSITVTGGTADPDEAAAGIQVTVKADAAPEGKKFDHWETVSGSIEPSDPNETSFTFTMPAEALEFKAVFTDADPSSDGFAVTVKGGTSDKDKAAEGEKVTLTADGAPEGKVFSHWESDNSGVIFDDENAQKTFFEMPASDVSVNAVFTDVPGEYVITDGDGQIYTLKSGKTLVFICSGELELFTGLEIDGAAVSMDCYDVSSGSTVAELKNAYLDSLSKGEHVIRFIYEDGESNEAVFTVIEVPPVTGTGRRTGLLFSMIWFSFIMILTATKEYRRRGCAK